MNAPAEGEGRATLEAKTAEAARVAREHGRKGGLAAAEARRAKKLAAAAGG